MVKAKQPLGLPQSAHLRAVGLSLMLKLHPVSPIRKLNDSHFQDWGIEETGKLSANIFHAHRVLSLAAAVTERIGSPRTLGASRYLALTRVFIAPAFVAAPANLIGIESLAGNADKRGGGGDWRTRASIRAGDGNRGSHRAIGGRRGTQGSRSRA